MEDVIARCAARPASGHSFPVTTKPSDEEAPGLRTETAQGEHYNISTYCYNNVFARFTSSVMTSVNLSSTVPVRLLRSHTTR